MPSRRPLHLFRKLGVVLLAYVALAYFILPAGWHFYETHRATGPEVLRTVTTIGIPGDPLNLALSGSQADLDRIMARAGWFRAEPITLASSLGIARSILFGSPDNQAPVSTLMFRSRPQDLAYEKPITLDADRRHHVRFWRVSQPDAPGPPLWYGAATEDVAVGLNHLTGQFTHHIDPDIDRERDALLTDLTATGQLGPVTSTPGIGPVKRGRNGEYDLFFTDGLIKRAAILPEG
jgi:hypothetical protein